MPYFSRLARRFANFSLLLSSLISSLAVSAASSDGPYLTSVDSSHWLARWVDFGDSSPSVREQRLKVGQSFEVGAVGQCPAFKVQVRKPEALAPDQVSFPAKNPLFIIADTHGEYEILCGFLQKHRVVDASLRWAFGRGHLVILGDIFDRGANQTEILWWLYQLEAQALRAGGGVHVLLGNHESMALRGDLRYLNPKYLQTATALGADNFAHLFSASTVLGQWLRSKPAVLKINGVLCLHGGISRETVDRGFTLTEMNAAVRAVLARTDAPSQELSEREQFVMGRQGPQWYRGYFADEKDFQTATDEDIAVILKAFDVQTIAVGHTIVPSVTPLYNNRVLAVQVYPHLDEQSHAPILEGVARIKGRWMRAGSDGALTPLF
jgi:hypothetical protein